MAEYYLIDPASVNHTWPVNYYDPEKEEEYRRQIAARIPPMPGYIPVGQGTMYMGSREGYQGPVTNTAVAPRQTVQSGDWNEVLGITPGPVPIPKPEVLPTIGVSGDAKPGEIAMVAAQNAKINQANEEAARRYAGQMEYQRLTKAGMPPEQAILQTYPMMYPENAPAMIRANAAERPEAHVDDFNFGGRTVPGLVQPSGTVTFPPTERRQYETPEQRAKRESLMVEFRDANEKANTINSWRPANDDEAVQNKQLELSYRDKANKIKKQLDELYSKPAPINFPVTNAPAQIPVPVSPGSVMNQGMVVPPGLEPTMPGLTPEQRRLYYLTNRESGPMDIAPMPQTQKELVKGKKYYSRAGVVTWNGEKFVK